MNILYFSQEAFYPVSRGNRSTIYQYIKRFKELGHRIHFVHLCEEKIEYKNYLEMCKLVDSFDIIPFEGKFFEKRNKKGYHEFDTKYPDGLGEIVESFCSKYSIDMVFCTYIFQSKILEYVPDNVVKIIDTHDRMTNRHIDLKKNDIKDEFFSCTKEDEAQYLNRADIVIARRKEEADFFNEITSSNKAITVSHFEPAIELNRDYKKLKKIGILASDNYINSKMIHDFNNEFLKHYKSNPIDVEIAIAGNVDKLINIMGLKGKTEKKHYKKMIYKLCYFIKRIVNKIKSINSPVAKYLKIKGFVDNIEDFYKDMDLILIPITFGTGINVKMVQAMAYGVPVVSTECGIKGMNSDSPYHHCENLEALVAKIYEIFGNPSELEVLSKVSKDCYKEFLTECYSDFDNMLKYAKDIAEKSYR